VAQRDRPDDDDLEFEFFDEPLTTEAPTRVEPPARPRGTPPPPPVPPRARTPGGRAPIIRLAALIVGAIVLAVALVIGINSCRGDGASAEYDEYLDSVGAVAGQSSTIGTQLVEVLATTGLTLDELQTQLGGLAEQQSQVVARAEALSPPGTLVQEQESLVEAMQLREAGLRGLERAVGGLQPASEPEPAGATLAEQARRIVAAGVVYDDLFKARTEDVLRSEGVTGVSVPESQFLSDPELLSADSFGELVRAITQGGTGEGAPAGLHGNGIAAVRVVDGPELSREEETEIVVAEGFAIEVDVENSGDFRETNVQVTLRIEFGTPVRKRQRIEIIEAGAVETVTFQDFNDINFAEPAQLKVSVGPVPGEENLDNNTYEYPVIFSIP
jgi:hypothetical protein